MNRVFAYLIIGLHTLQDRIDTREDRGATAVEYGLLVGLIAVVIIVAVTALGGKLTGLFNSITSGI